MSDSDEVFYEEEIKYRDGISKKLQSNVSDPNTNMQRGGQKEESEYKKEYIDLDEVSQDDKIMRDRVRHLLQKQIDMGYHSLFRGGGISELSQPKYADMEDVKFDHHFSVSDDMRHRVREMLKEQIDMGFRDLFRGGIDTRYQECVKCPKPTKDKIKMKETKVKKEFERQEKIQGGAKEECFQNEFYLYKDKIYDHEGKGLEMDKCFKNQHYRQEADMHIGHPEGYEGGAKKMRYQDFVKKYRKEGKSMKEISKMWKEHKSGGFVAIAKGNLKHHEGAGKEECFKNEFYLNESQETAKAGTLTPLHANGLSEEMLLKGVKLDFLRKICEDIGYPRCKTLTKKKIIQKIKPYIKDYDFESVTYEKKDGGCGSCKLKGGVSDKIRKQLKKKIKISPLQVASQKAALKEMKRLKSLRDKQNKLEFFKKQLEGMDKDKKFEPKELIKEDPTVEGPLRELKLLDIRTKLTNGDILDLLDGALGQIDKEVLKEDKKIKEKIKDIKIEKDETKFKETIEKLKKMGSKEAEESRRILEKVKQERVGELVEKGQEKMEEEMIDKIYKEKIEALKDGDVVKGEKYKLSDIRKVGRKDNLLKLAKEFGVDSKKPNKSRKKMIDKTNKELQYDIYKAMEGKDLIF